jgi:alpha-galactosidase/6-phospho-beta-glucosidase family protein
MSGVTIAVIGAGSAQFSLGLVRDLATLPSLAGSHVRFMDIDETRVGVTHAVAERYTSEAGADLTFSRTLDRSEALDGAGFVVNCALVGGWRGRGYLREIASKYAEGNRRASLSVLSSFRQLDLFASVARDIQRLCPDAWYIQSANPMVSGITLVNRVADINAVGLCHGIADVGRISKEIGLDPSKVTAQAYGVNHFIWLKNYFCDGQDAYPALNEWIEKEAPAFWKSDRCTPSHALGPKAIELYRMLGLFPIGDTCTPGGGNWPDWFRKTPEMVEQWNEDTGAWMQRHIRNMESRLGEFEKALADTDRPLTEEYPLKPTGETNVTIIDALANDRGGLFQVNVLNQGAIPGLPDDIAAEFPAYVSGAGIQRLEFPALPEPIMHLTNERVARVQDEVETYLSRSRDRLLLSILTRSNLGYDEAKALMEEILSHPDNSDMAGHFE